MTSAGSGWQLGRAVLAAVLAISIATDIVTIWWLIIVALGRGVGEILVDSSSQAAVPQLVDEDQLDRANGQLITVITLFDQVVGVASFASCASTCRVSRFGRWSRPNRCWVQWSRVAHGRRGSGRARSHRRRRHHRGGKRSCVANLAAAAVELVSWAMLVLALRHLDDALAERSRTSVT